jgi:predicted TIM-barrel fold metal-dependent hydrolase
MFRTGVRELAAPGGRVIQRPADLTKLHEGRTEPIVDPGLPIVDAHHHLYDRPNLRYLLEDYLTDANAGHNVVASVYIETMEMARPDGPEVLRPLGEVEFANGVAAVSASGRYGPCRVAAAIVGHADLTQGDRVAELLDRSLGCAPDRFRGVRMVTLQSTDTSWRRFVIMPLKPASGVLASTSFREGFRHLAPRGLSFDASVFHSQLAEVTDLARAFPDTVILLEHMGLALGLDLDERGRAEVFQDWRRGLEDLATNPNVMCKIGGLGLPFWGFGLENRPDAIGSVELAALWQPYVDTAIEAFSVERCLMQSDYPPDGRSCGFVPLWNALKLVTRGYSAAERLALFHNNAARVYRLDAGVLVGRPSIETRAS